MLLFVGSGPVCACGSIADGRAKLVALLTNVIELERTGVMLWLDCNLISLTSVLVMKDISISSVSCW